MGTQHYLSLWRSVGNDTFGVYTADNIRKANFLLECLMIMSIIFAVSFEVQ